MSDKGQIEAKIEEAKEILKCFEFSVPLKNKIMPLTLLALCNIKPDDKWENAERSSMTLTKDIMDFVNNYYEQYRPNSRETFRNQALNPFIELSLVDLNPDKQDLPATSSKTHYAISLLALNTLRKYKTDQWGIAVDNFLKIRDQKPNLSDSIPKLESLKIVSYKSIRKDKIDLGRFNVFIGANGCGKTNILESIATAGAYNCNDLTYEGLYGRGVRMARPNLLISSFAGSSNTSIDLQLDFSKQNNLETYRCSLVPTNLNDSYTKWVNLIEVDGQSNNLIEIFSEITKQNPGLSGEQLLEIAKNKLNEKGFTETERSFDKILIDYSIYDLNTKSLRGITPADSKRTPLGLNGEGLDLLISSFNVREKRKLMECIGFFDWLSEIVSDKDEKLKNAGLKPGRSTSTLYFKDRYMDERNNMLSAENSNEGILHVLFYFALFISDKTPNLFAIDNIETALNPRMCQALVKQLVALSKENHKQVLVTTHNPAVLDGLNLLDDDQRLFEVHRDSAGHTVTKRIKFKKDLVDKPSKLSQMWLTGTLGGLPKNF